MTKYLPKVVEKYWAIDVYYFGQIEVSRLDTPRTSLKYNCFRTKKEAQAALKKIKAILINE